MSKLWWQPQDSWVRSLRLLDLFCGAGGAAMGYSHAGFDEIVGVDIAPQPRYPFIFVQADALEYLAEHGHEFDAIHASPPCQGYSVMHNLPWLRGKEYPLLILPTIETLEGLGKPYVVENVMGARHGAKGLKKRGLESHGLKAGWLCGTMFGLPFYRHRLFASNWFWLAPGHPKHRGRVTTGQSPKRKGSNVSQQIVANPVNTAWRLTHDGRGSTQTKPHGEASLHRSLHVSTPSLAHWQGNGAQGNGVGSGHAKGWRLAAEAMGIDWMKRDELTQAIPPAYTEFIGRQLHLTVVVSAGLEV